MAPRSPRVATLRPRNALFAPRAAHSMPQFVREHTDDTPYAPDVFSTLFSTHGSRLVPSLAISIGLLTASPFDPTPRAGSQANAFPWLGPQAAHAQQAGPRAVQSDHAQEHAQTVRISAGGLTGRVQWQKDAARGAVVHVKLGRGRTTMPWARRVRGRAEVDVTAFKLGGRALALVRVGEDGEGVAVLFETAKGTVIAEADEFFRGDPGERVRTRLNVMGPTGPQPTVTRLQESERQRRCDGTPLPLFETRLDAKLEWRPVTRERAGAQRTLPSGRESTSPLPPTLLSWTGVTGGFGAKNPAGLIRPTALTDADPTSDFQLSEGEQVRAEARWTLPSLPPASLIVRTASATPPPTQLRVHLDDATMVVELEADSRGQTLSFPLPRTEHLACVAIELANGRGETAALADLGFATTLHEPSEEADTTRRLQEALQALGDSDTTRAGAAARTLALVPDRSRALLVSTWSSLSGRAKRRGLSLARAQADDAALWIAAALDPDERVFEEVKARAARWNAEAEPLTLALTKALMEATPAVGDGRSAWALSRVATGGGKTSVSFLARQLEPSRPLRDHVRLSLRAMAGRVPERVREALAAATDLPVDQLALALAGTPLDGEALLYLRQVMSAEDASFEARYAAVQASARAGRAPDVDAWLERVISGSDVWMLRQAAVEALKARGALSPSTLRRGLSDPYPRVRAATIAALPAKAETRAVLRQLLKSDPWPLVRAAAVARLPLVPDGAAVLREGLDDPSRVVRRASLEALTESQDRGAAKAVAARLERAEEWPDVRHAAIAYAQALCAFELEPALVLVARRGLDPRAPAAEQETGTHALLVLASLASVDPVLADAIAQDPGGHLQARLEQQKRESSCSSARR